MPGAGRPDYKASAGVKRRSRLIRRYKGRRMRKASDVDKTARKWQPTDCNEEETSGNRHSIYSFRLLASASWGAGVHAAVSHDILYPLSDKIRARKSSFTNRWKEIPKGTTKQ